MEAHTRKSEDSAHELAQLNSKVDSKIAEDNIEEVVNEAAKEDKIKEVKKPANEPEKKYEDPLNEDYQTELKNKHGRKFLCQPDWDKQHLEPHTKSV